MDRKENWTGNKMIQTEKRTGKKMDWNEIGKWTGKKMDRKENGPEIKWTEKKMG